MTEHRTEGPGENGPGAAVPRDLPDQQAGAGPDPLDVPGADDSDEDDDVPGTDESGTGPRGTPRRAPQSGQSEQPVPDEPAD